MGDPKKNARVQLKYAVDRGKLKRLPCEVCGNPKSEGHHENYSNPLDVKWLCQKHHTVLHHGGDGNPRVILTFRTSLKKELKKLAAADSRSVSNLVELLLVQALAARQSQGQAA